jgi:hypothetical protein
MLSEAGFTEVLKTSFGDNYQPVAVEADKILRANLSDADYTEIDSKIPNQYVGVLYRFAAKIAQQYGINDAGKAGGENPSGNQKGDVKSTQSELRKKIVEADAAGKWEDKKRYQAELEETYGIKKKA